MGKIAVVVVHGIGSGTGEERCEFSKTLEKNVKISLPDGADLVWEEANWEKLNDEIDAIIKRGGIVDVLEKDTIHGRLYRGT